ncbi:MAG: DUF167 domain-containing protein [Acidobacteria bacterium]|nr:DUF167 domain-containing protein [Acidobacteriota bacterium]
MIEADAQGIVITIRVIPRASPSGVAGTRDGAVLVRLNAPPVEGAANAELVHLIAKALGVPKRAVTILSGERNRTKRVQVAGIDAATATTRLGLSPGQGA